MRVGAMNWGGCDMGIKPYYLSRYSEQFNSVAGAPRSAVNGFPLHLLVKSSPQKGSLRFATNLNSLLCFFSSVAVTGGAS